jgi:hypothetical protein
MFTNRFIASIAGTLLSAATLGLAAITSAGAADASTADDTYVATLAQAGIPRIDPAKEIMAGYAVCVNLSEGPTPNQLIDAFVARKVFATREQDAAMINAAISAYCPQYRS